MSARRLIVFAVGFLSLALVQGLAIYAMHGQLQAAAEQARTTRIQEAMVQLRLHIVSTQEAQRSWLLLQDATSKQQFEEHQLKAAELASELQRLTRDNPAQERRAAALQAAVTRRIEFMRGLIHRREARESLDVTESLARGNQDTRDILQRLDEMEVTERRLLEQRARSTTSFARLAQEAVVLGGSASVVLLALAFAQMVRNERVQADLLQQTTRQAELLSLASDAIFAWDGEDRLVYWNRGAERAYGYSAEEALGRSPSKLLRTRFPVPRADIQAALDAEGSWEGELVQQRQDGEMRTTESRWAQKVTDGDRVVLEINTDVTARKQAERDAREAREALERNVEELRASNEELEQFAYVASHDLQEPLRMVSSYTQLLQKRYKGRLDSEADEFIAYAVDGANRMQHLIRDLLSYSRVSSGGRTPAPVALDDTLAAARQNLATAIHDSQGEVVVEPLPMVLGDRVQLVQLLQNLVGNGLKYRHAERPPVVRVFARDLDDERCEVGVADNGIGIDSQYLERIFVIFQRLHGREQYPGTGIGLAICKKIVERHGGKIRVESSPGMGTTFYFTLTRENGSCLTPTVESASTSSSSRTTPATSA